MIIDPRLKDKKTLIDFYYAESDANTLVANGNADNTKDIFVYATNGQFTIFNPFTNECENASSIMKRIH